MNCSPSKTRLNRICLVALSVILAVLIATSLAFAQGGDPLAEPLNFERLTTGHTLKLFERTPDAPSLQAAPTPAWWQSGWLYALVAAAVLAMFGYVYQTKVNQLKTEKAAAAIRESEEKYRVLFESFPLGITVTDKAGNILETNVIAEKLLGVPPQKHKERSIDGAEWRLIRPDGSPMPADEYASVIALRENRRVENVEMGIVKPDETITWLSVTAAPIPLENYGVIISYGDITERKQAEAKLKESEDRFKKISSLASDYAYSILIHGDGSMENEWHFGAFEKITGYDPVKIWQDGDVAKLFYPADLSILGQRNERLLKGETVTTEARIVTKSGELKWIRDTGKPEWDEQQQRIIRLLGSASEITAQKQAEQVLRESDERYRRAQELGHVGNWEYNLQTTEFWGSAEAKRIYGFEPDAATFTTEKVESCILERERVHQALVDLIERGAEYNLEFEIITDDTQQRRTIISVAQLERDADGNPLKVTGVIHDITTRKRAEEQLKTSLKEKEVLLQELYHRTKNNMNVISSLLSLQADYLHDEQAQAIFADMRHRIQSMAMVHQKLYQSKNLTSIDLKEYTNDLADYLLQSYNIMFSRITVKKELESVPVLIDTAMPCGLVLNELISNACKHAFPDNRPGEISISLCQTATGEIMLQVADNGVGVPAGFNFRQTESLGLKTVVAIVECQLRGSIAFNTDNGVACRVLFEDKHYQSRV